MFKVLPALLMLLAPVSLRSQATQTAALEKTAGDIYKMTGPSVVLIETYGDDGKLSGSGSGFLVSADGRILCGGSSSPDTRVCWPRRLRRFRLTVKRFALAGSRGCFGPHSSRHN
jgi:hypothetical protein